MAQNFAGELRDVPFLGMLLARAEGIDQLAREILGDAQRVLFLVFAFERRAADGVDRLALLVHYIVVFEQVFAGLEVLRFDGLLRVFDAARDELGLDGHAFGHAQAIHQGFDALAAEDAQQIVFEREEEARRAGIALAAGAAAKLIIDAAGLVAFGAENVQAAQGDDFVALGAALLGELIVDRLPLIERNLEDLAFDLEEHHVRRRSGSRLAPSGADHRGGRGVGHGQAVLEAIVAGHGLGIAAEQNVGAAAGHVGGDGDGAFAAGLRDDVRFALVLLGVEHLVRDAGLLEQLREVLGFFDGDRADQHGLAALVKLADAVGLASHPRESCR